QPVGPSLGRSLGAAAQLRVGVALVRAGARHETRRARAVVRRSRAARTGGVVLVTTIESKISVAGMHFWPGAPDEVKFLASKHRHLFVIRARQTVAHQNRATEFITLGYEIQQFLEATFDKLPCGALDFGERSCE